MIHLYNNGEETLFIASVVVYGLSYVGQELCFVKKPIYLILSLIGLSWFRLPYSIKFGKQSVYAVFATIFEMIALIYGGVQNAYFIYQNRIIPLYFPEQHTRSNSSHSGYIRPTYLPQAPPERRFPGQAPFPQGI